MLCDIDLISQMSPYAVFKVTLLISLPPTLPHPSVCHAACSPCGEQRANVGLNLKFNKKNEEVPGYTKRTEREWLYSLAVEELLAEYLERLNRPTLPAFGSFVIEVCKMLNIYLLAFVSSLSFSPPPSPFRFSEVFNTVSRNSHDDIFYEDDIWPGLDQNG